MAVTFRHLTSTSQLQRSDVDQLLLTAEDMAVFAERGGCDLCKGKILAALFYEPSTRTRLSFETAMLRLGGQVITADGVQFSSMSKGETIEDTIMVAGQYADVIAMRHPEKGSAEKAAAVSPVPFINAGDGPGEHPTQALLDLFTIRRERGGLDGLHVAMVGDLKYGRTVHSLSVLLALFPGTRFTFIAPPNLRMPEEVLSTLRGRGITWADAERLEDGLGADVLYMTRVQKERFDNLQEYERLKHAFILSANHLQGRGVTVLHPLPRVGEIETAVDALPNAAYFRQVHNGVPMRMAIIAHLLDAA